MDQMLAMDFIVVVIKVFSMPILTWDLKIISQILHLSLLDLVILVSLIRIFLQVDRLVILILLETLLYQEIIIILILCNQTWEGKEIKLDQTVIYSELDISLEGLQVQIVI